MTEAMIATAKACLAGAENNTMNFPAIVGALIAAGFESYQIDLRRGLAVYFAGDGTAVELKALKPEASVAPALDAVALKAAITEAQQQVAGYTFLDFCRKAAAAGCAFYVVSFSGRRVLYVGRTGETHTEHFPK